MKLLTCFRRREAAFLLALVFEAITSRSYSFHQVRSYNPRKVVAISAPPYLTNLDIGFHNDHIDYCATSLRMSYEEISPSDTSSRFEGDPHVETILFVECGFGNDSHGES